MAHRLNDRVILVTGGASGIGAALCRGFAHEGAHVVVADLNATAAIEVATDITQAGGSAIGVAMDVTDRAQVAAGVAVGVKAFGKLDAYFNNAGMNSPMKLLNVSEDNF